MREEKGGGSPKPLGHGRWLMPNGDRIELHRSSVWRLGEDQSLALAIHRPLAHEAISRTDVAQTTIHLSDAQRIAIGDLQQFVVARILNAAGVRFYRDGPRLYVWRLWGRRGGGARGRLIPACVVGWDELALREEGRRTSKRKSELNPLITRKASSGRDSRAGGRR